MNRRGISVAEWVKFGTLGLLHQLKIQTVSFVKPSQALPATSIFAHAHHVGRKGQVKGA